MGGGLALWLCAANGLWLVRFKRMAFAMVHWLLGWMAQSFAPQLAVASVLLAITCLTLSPEHALSMASALLYGSAAILFLQIHLRGHHCAKVLRQALNPGLSSAAASAALAAVDPSPDPALRWAGLRPFHWNRAAVQRIRDVPYGEVQKFNLLDVYRPVSLPKALMPVLIQIPGGAWVTSNKNHQAKPLLHHMAARGWLCFAINYRLGPEARFPDMMQDVLRAIAWVKVHAADYGGDASFLALTGGSAGGHLASLAGLLRERGRFQAGFESADTRVNAVVPFCGRYDFLDRHHLLSGDEVKRFLESKVMPCSPAADPELWNLASPVAQVHADAPPFFIIHGDHDTFIPVEEAREFRDALAAVSTEAVVYAELPGTQHVFDIFRCSSCAHTLVAVRRFLEAQLRTHRLSAKHTN